jgi:hypothetical protein
MAEESARSDVEAAVIGHGEVEGPFTEIDGLAIRRDGRFPIRVTVQFYKATSDGIVTESDIEEIAEQIDRVYEDGDYVGSLVVDGPRRPAEYDGEDEPPGWWDAFWIGSRTASGLAAGAMDLLPELVVAWRWAGVPRVGGLAQQLARVSGWALRGGRGARRSFRRIHVAIPLMGRTR